MTQDGIGRQKEATYDRSGKSYARSFALAGTPCEASRSVISISLAAETLNPAQGKCSRTAKDADGTGKLNQMRVTLEVYTPAHHFGRPSHDTHWHVNAPYAGKDDSDTRFISCRFIVSLVLGCSKQYHCVVIFETPKCMKHQNSGIQPCSNRRI